MGLDRSATASYSQSLKAEQMARGGLQLVVAQLQQEMAKDSNPDLTYAGKALYTNVMPLSLTGVLQLTNLAPQGVGTNAAMVNLIKTSVNQPFFTNSPLSTAKRVSSLKSTAINSAIPSLNGRSVSAARWNQACLGTFPADNTTTPYWVMITRAGPTNAAGLTFGSAAANTLNNSTTANTNYAIGRVAYAVYDEGGLLNVTVAGYPSAAASTAEKKGATAWADLSQIPGVNDAEALVKWRNAATYSNYETYATNYAAANGFGKVYPGDTTFLSRSDLIHYAKANPGVISPGALPYLTTFSWELNSPSWRPSALTTGLNYANLSKTVTSTNVFLPLVRVTTGGWTRRDGTLAVKGEPLILRRFPLSKLNLLNATTAPAVVDESSEIYSYFGLTRTSASAPWVYRRTSPAATTSQNSIKALASATGSVVAANREPDFFELLQACLLNGSVGQYMLSNTDANNYTGYTGNNTVGPLGPDTWRMRQIMQIGANIIDQATADNYPTVISFTTGTYTDQVAGTKDLPYPHTFLTKILTYNPSITTFPAGWPTGPDWFSTSINAEMAFSMWNPHQLNANTTTLQGPTNFQVTVNAPGSYAFYSFGVNQPTAPPIPPGTSTFGTIGAVSGTSIPFTVPNPLDGNADYRSSPRVIRYDGSQSSAATLDFPINPANPTLPKAIGYKMPAPGIYVPGNTAAGVKSAPFFYAHSYNNIVFSFEYKDPTGAWKTYATMSGPTNQASSFGIHNSGNYVYMNSPSPSGSPNLSLYPPYTLPDNTDGFGYLKSDPRTYRFGLSYSPYCQKSGTGTMMTNYPKGDYPLIPTSTATTDSYQHSIQQNPNGAPGSCRIDLYSQNTTTLTGGYNYNPYLDPDGEMRPGDCYLSSANQPMSLIPAQVANRPIILSRPLRSVGELGYTFRDAPWKTIDFSSAKSPDGGLLDAFTVMDSPLIAGKVNLNTKNPEVLQALIAGARNQEVSQTTLPQLPSTATTTLDAATATAVAAAIVQKTALLPLSNIAELPIRLPAINSSLTTPMTSKMKLEAITRALADTTGTRTWNLMIDVVAQSGKYPPTATSLEQFVVEGERRYWMHVAIDRFTGQVIAQKVEVPTE